MKCLSLTQPWASLVVEGLKCYETRSWRTNYRGELAIHASATMPRWSFDLMQTHDTFIKVLARLQYSPAAPSYRGCVLGTVQLVDCVPVEDVRDDIAEREFDLGNYEDRRYAWKLEGAVKFERPIPAKGALQLWEWER